MIDINTECVLYCVTGDDAIDSFDDLDGKTIVTTGQGATPEYAIRYLLDAYGITADLDFHSEATEIASILAQDSSTIAILPQPFATAATIQNTDVHEAFSLNDSWNDIADGKSSMVQGVTIVNNDFLKAHPEAVRTFLREQAASVEKAGSDVSGTAELVAKYGIVEKAAVAEKALPKCAIVCVTGEEMKTKLSTSSASTARRRNSPASSTSWQDLTLPPSEEAFPEMISTISANNPIQFHLRIPSASAASLQVRIFRRGNL